MDPPVSVGLVTTRDRSVSPPTEVLLDRCADASVAFEWHPSAYYVVALLTASGAVYAPSPSKPVRVSFDVVHARTSAGSPPPGGPYALTSLTQSKVWHGKYFSETSDRRPAYPIETEMSTRRSRSSPSVVPL